MTSDVILKVGRPEFEFLLWHFLSVTLTLYPLFTHFLNINMGIK